MNRTFWVCVLLMTVFSLCFAQATTYKDVPNRNGLVIGYNRFTDRTIIMTKRQLVNGVAGKRNLLDPNASSRPMEITALFSYTGKPSKTAINDVVVVISPTASTRGGAFLQKMDERKWYISPESQFNVIADGDRIPLGQVAKTFSYDIGGNYDDNAYIVIPVETFRKIVASKKTEMAVGPLEIRNIDKFKDRMKELLAELDSL